MTAITKSMAENEFNRQAGLFLRRVRMMQGLTQKELATRTGITFQQVQKYESGESRVSLWRMCQFADALEISVAPFFENGFPDAKCRVLDYRKIQCMIDTIVRDLGELRHELLKR